MVLSMGLFSIFKNDNTQKEQDICSSLLYFIHLPSDSFYEYLIATKMILPEELQKIKSYLFSFRILVLCRLSRGAFNNNSLITNALNRLQVELKNKMGDVTFQTLWGMSLGLEKIIDKLWDDNSMYNTSVRIAHLSLELADVSKDEIFIRHDTLQNELNPLKDRPVGLDALAFLFATQLEGYTEMVDTIKTNIK